MVHFSLLIIQCHADFGIFLAATHPSGVLGPNPVQEGSVVLPSSTHDPLFLPGTDDEGVASPQNDDEVEGTEGEDGNGRAAANADSNGDSSSIPTKA